MLWNRVVKSRLHSTGSKHHVWSSGTKQLQSKRSSTDLTASRSLLATPSLLNCEETQILLIPSNAGSGVVLREKEEQKLITRVKITVGGSEDKAIHQALNDITSPSTGLQCNHFTCMLWCTYAVFQLNIVWSIVHMYIPTEPSREQRIVFFRGLILWCNHSVALYNSKTK